MSTIAPVPDSSKTTPKKTIQTFRQKKAKGEPICMLTGYDYPTALALDRAGIDAILVGDSLGMVVLGYDNTLPVSMTEMLHHCRAVAKGAKSALLIGDMPFMSYQVSIEEAVRNAGRFLQEAGMDAIKLEGGRERLNTIRAISVAFLAGAITLPAARASPNTWAWARKPMLGLGWNSFSIPAVRVQTSSQTAGTIVTTSTVVASKAVPWARTATGGALESIQVKSWS